MNSVESMKQEMINEMQTQIQFFNEHIIDSICKLVANGLSKIQKRGEFNIKKRVSDEIKCTEASQYVVDFLKPFFEILLNPKFHEKNRLRLLYNLTDKLVNIFTKHYQNYTVTEEGAMLLSGDINKYNDLFLRVEEDDIIKKYEAFKLLINLYLLDVNSLEPYIKEHLLSI